MSATFKQSDLIPKLVAFPNRIGENVYLSCQGLPFKSVWGDIAACVSNVLHTFACCENQFKLSSKETAIASAPFC